MTRRLSHPARADSEEQLVLELKRMAEEKRRRDELARLEDRLANINQIEDVSDGLLAQKQILERRHHELKAEEGTIVVKAPPVGASRRDQAWEEKRKKFFAIPAAFQAPASFSPQAPAPHVAPVAHYPQHEPLPTGFQNEPPRFQPVETPAQLSIPPPVYESNESHDVPDDHLHSPQITQPTQDSRSMHSLPLDSNGVERHRENLRKQQQAELREWLISNGPIVTKHVASLPGPSSHLSFGSDSFAIEEAQRNKRLEQQAELREWLALGVARPSSDPVPSTGHSIMDMPSLTASVDKRQRAEEQRLALESQIRERQEREKKRRETERLEDEKIEREIKMQIEKEKEEKARETRPVVVSEYKASKLDKSTEKSTKKSAEIAEERWVNPTIPMRLVDPPVVSIEPQILQAPTVVESKETRPQTFEPVPLRPIDLVKDEPAVSHGLIEVLASQQKHIFDLHAEQVSELRKRLEEGERARREELKAAIDLLKGLASQSSLPVEPLSSRMQKSVSSSDNPFEASLRGGTKFVDLAGKTFRPSARFDSSSKSIPGESTFVDIPPSVRHEASQEASHAKDASDLVNKPMSAMRRLPLELRGLHSIVEDPFATFRQDNENEGIAEALKEGASLSRTRPGSGRMVRFIESSSEEEEVADQTFAFQTMGESIKKGPFWNLKNALSEADFLDSEVKEVFGRIINS